MVMYQHPESHAKAVVDGDVDGGGGGGGDGDTSIQKVMLKRSLMKRLMSRPPMRG